MLRKIFLLLTVLGVALGSFLFLGGQNNIIDSLVNTIFHKDEASAVQEFPMPGKTFYRMKLKVDARDNKLYGSSIIATINTAGQPLKTLQLLLYPQIMADQNTSPASFDAYYSGFIPSGMKLTQVRVNGASCETRIDGINAVVSLPSPVPIDASIIVETEWEIPVPLVKYRFGRYYTEWFFSECYPILVDKEFVQPSYAGKLYGQPFCINAADYEVSIIYPDNLNLVSNTINAGRQAAQDGHEVTVLEANSIRDFCFFLVYDYDQSERSQNGYRVVSNFPSSKSANSPMFLSAACDIISFYEDAFGKYPYPELVMLAGPLKGLHGMEYSGLILLQSDFTGSGYESERQIYILAQEIAHQWWGELVGNDQLKEPWLDEGLSSWCAYQYMENKLNLDTTYRGILPRTDDYGKYWQELCASQEYQLTGYSGPDEFWFALEKQIGQDMIFKVLKQYVKTYSHKHATTKDFLVIVNKQTGNDYTAFFAGWFPSEFKETGRKD